MTKSQCYSEIARNEQLILQCQEEIETLSKEIGELEEAEQKVTNMKTTLTTCKQTGVTRLSDTGEVNKINSKIAGKIFSNINNLFTGSEYTNVFGGLGTAIERVQDEILRKKKEVLMQINHIAGNMEIVVKL